MDKFIKRIIDFIKRINNLRYKEIKLGKKREDVIYVIRFFHGEGLMSMLYKALGNIEYAEQKGYIPMIDLKHFKNIYQNGGVKKMTLGRIFFSNR